MKMCSMHAVIKSNVSERTHLLDLLLEYGADINAVNRHNESGQFVSFEKHSPNPRTEFKYLDLIAREIQMVK